MFRSILIPIEHCSPHTDAAVASTVDLAKLTDATIRVVHAEEEIPLAEQGAQACRSMVGTNAELGVTWGALVHQRRQQEDVLHVRRAQSRGNQKGDKAEPVPAVLSMDAFIVSKFARAP
jgi:nucleotide-binding universal stress UspA family protein